VRLGEVKINVSECKKIKGSKDHLSTTTKNALIKVYRKHKDELNTLCDFLNKGISLCKGYFLNNHYSSLRDGRSHDLRINITNRTIQITSNDWHTTV
jgi:hypothetical protein